VGEQEKFRDRIVPLSASALATITMATIGSYLPFGVLGTLGGLAAGSVLSGAASWWYERGLRHSRAAVARAKARAARKRNPWGSASSSGLCTHCSAPVAASRPGRLSYPTVIEAAASARTGTHAPLRGR
jgi:hypothetical protein